MTKDLAYVTYIIYYSVMDFVEWIKMVTSIICWYQMDSNKYASRF